jgi:hypothetical protein
MIKHLLASCLLCIMITCFANEAEPREVLRRMHSALITNNKQEFKLCFDGEDEQHLLDTTFDLARSNIEFKKVLDQKFGPGAWDRFEKAKIAPGKPSLQLKMISDDPMWYQNVKLDREGDVYTFVNPATGLVNRIGLVDSRYKILTSSMIPAGANPKDIGKLISRISRALIDTLEFVKKKDPTISEVKEHLADEFVLLGQQR